MGIKKFFKKVGSGIQRAASWTKDKFHKTVNVVKKFGKPVLNVANKISGVLSMVPGTVGAVATAVNAGTGIANSVLDQLPSGKVKSKVTNVVNKATTQANTGVSKAQQYAGKVADVGRGIQSGIQTAHNIGRTIQDGVQRVDMSPVKRLLNQT